MKNRHYLSNIKYFYNKKTNIFIALFIGILEYV